MGKSGIQKILHLHIELAKKSPKVFGDYIVSEKIDGIYTYIDRIDGKWSSPYSRANRLIPAFENYAKVFRLLDNIPEGDIRIIAEAYIPKVDFYTTNGIFNRSVGDYHCKEVKFAVHDIIYGNRLQSNLERYNRLQQVDPFASAGIIEIHPILAISADKEHWLHYANQVWDNGGEGVVLKHVDSPYYPDKRNSSLMKIKLEETFIIDCVDIFYTTGEKGHSNLNATFRKNDDVEVVCRIGKHSDIAAIENDKNVILGKPCKIVAMCELPNGQLREPRFKTVLG